jgi:hypothetical protein
MTFSVVYGASPPPKLPLLVNVPNHGRSLIGRESELADVRIRLARGDTVAVCGQAGVGKTAFALALAHEQGTPDGLTGGVLWAGLGPQGDVDSVLSQWATELRVDVSAERSTDARAQRLSAHLRSILDGQPCLFVFDDAWRWQDIAPFQHFAGRGCARLLTTRDQQLARRFSAARPPYILDLLPPEAAIALLTRDNPRALEVAPSGVADLARVVGRLPLALTLIGARLSLFVDQPSEMRRVIEELQDARGYLELEDTQQRPGLAEVPLNLRAVVELSVQYLPDEPTRRAYASLASFAPEPSDFSRAAALTVWDVPADLGDSWLLTLRSRSLIEAAGDDRYIIHQVLAAVADLHLANRAAFVDRHRHYFLELVRRDPEDWQSILAELAQIRHVWRNLVTPPVLHTEVLDLAFAMRLFMERQGLRAEHLLWLDQALTSARAVGDRLREARVLLNIGLVQHARGALDQALEASQQALVLIRAIGYQAGEVTSLNNIGQVHFARGELDRAMDYFQMALPIVLAVGNAVGRRPSLTTSGWFTMPVVS